MLISSFPSNMSWAALKHHQGLCVSYMQLLAYSVLSTVNCFICLQTSANPCQITQTNCLTNKSLSAELFLSNDAVVSSNLLMVSSSIVQSLLTSSVALSNTTDPAFLLIVPQGMKLVLASGFFLRPEYDGIVLILSILYLHVAVNLQTTRRM